MRFQLTGSGAQRLRRAVGTGAAAAVWLAALGALSCGGTGQTDASPSGSGEVRGAIVGFESRSLLEFDSVDVRDGSGVVWRFDAGSYRGFTPSHLRDHMVQGLPVTVRYHAEDGVLVIDDLFD
jgi:hypothetical protein